MGWIDGLRHRLRAVLDPARHEREVREELEFHQSLDGQQVGDAHAARRRFGNRTYYQEEVRRMTWLGQLDVLRQDLGFGWRSMRRAPGVTAMIVLTLALGLGVNAATFTFLDRLYLRAPAGVERPDDIRRYWFETSAERSYNGKSFVSPGTDVPTYRAIARASGEPFRFALYDTDNMLFLRRGEERVRVRGVFATASYFQVLGVRAELGRLYSAQEDSMGHGAPVVVLGHRFWQRELAGDTAVLGSVLRLETADYTVVGILQRDFEGLDLQSADVWFPMASIPPSHWMASRPNWWLGDIVNGMALLERTPSGTNASDAEQRATMVVRETRRALRGRMADTLGRALTAPLYGSAGPGEEGQDMKIAKRLGAVSLIILVIACANVINLLLARSERRRREIAVRLALGVSRGRLVRLLATETLMLALLAGAAAVLAGWWGGTLLRAMLFRSVTWYEPAVNLRVVLFAGVLSVVAGLIAGIIPAVQASSPKLGNALKEGAREGRRRSRLRSTLVVTQAALSVMLLAGAALFVRSLNNVRGLDIGYDTDRLLFGRVSFEPDQRRPAAVIAATMDEIAARLASRSGVASVARSDITPLQGISFANFFWDADSAASLRPNTPTFISVSANFFATTGMRVLRGTTFDDVPSPRQLVINEAMAQRLWPGQNAVGKCLRFARRDAPCHTVTGIVENARQNNVIEPEPVPLFYLPLGDGSGAMRYVTTIIVRARPDAERAARVELSGALASAFPAATPSVQSMLEALDGEYWPWQLGARLFTGFGLLALLVAMIGIYSTVSYTVTQRFHEFGVRAALGARVVDLLRQVVGEGARVAAIGVVVGTALTLASGKLIASMLYDVKPSDPLTLLLVGGALLGVAVAAALMPAWRAARVDPVIALRSD